MLDLITALGGNLAAYGVNVPELMRRVPGETPAGGNENALIAAAKKRALSLGAEPVEYQLRPTRTTGNTEADLKKLISNQLAGHIDSESLERASKMGIPTGVDSGIDVVAYNPNSDAAMLAHELGHGVSAKTKVGKNIRNMRSNPKLALAASLAGILAPVGAAAVLPGDEDAGASLALAYGAIAPALADEALASKNALAIMKDAGMPANLKQRGRLAGAYLSYATAPMFGGLLLNKAGNFIDSDIEE
jgi:hypothetical protein